MKITTRIGSNILSLIVLLLIPFDLVQVDGFWGRPHKLSAATETIRPTITSHGSRQAPEPTLQR